MKYFMYEYKRVTILGKLYLIPKIHKRLYDVPGKPVISNCGTPTEKVSEFLCKRDGLTSRTPKIFKENLKYGKIPQDSILVTADVVGLYPSIPHNAGLKALKDPLDCRQNTTGMLVKMAEFVLTNNYVEFGRKVFHQISGTAIGMKFAPPYVCIFMDKFETNFFKTQKLQSLVWFRYIDVFFIWTHGKEELENFMKKLNSFSDRIKFTFESDKENNNYLDVNINLSNGHLMTNMYVTHVTVMSIWITHHLNPTISNVL